MELALKAPFAGTVTEVDAAAGRAGRARRHAVRRRAGEDGVDAASPSGSRSTRSARATACRTRQALVPTEVKAEFVRRLLAAGLPVVEATSFVHPKWVPQLADAAELMTRARRGRAATCPVLVPNERGLDRALELGCGTSRSSARATETFAQKNLNRSLDEQFAMFEPTVRRARDAGLDVRAYVSMCFGDPWEGAVPVEQVVGVGKRLFDLGASQLSLGDTIGVGTAGHVKDLVGGVRRRRHEHRPAGDALPRHLRPGARQRLLRAPGGHHDVRRQRGRPRRLPLRRRAPPATSPPRTWCGCSPGSASSTASTSTPLVATSVWMAGQLGRPSPSAVVRALAQ